MIGLGKNTVLINGEPKHITDLTPLELCNEWSKLKNENNELYRCIKVASSSWRGLILRLIGVHLPDGKTIIISGINANGESIYPERCSTGENKS